MFNSTGKDQNYFSRVLYFMLDIRMPVTKTPAATATNAARGCEAIGAVCHNNTATTQLAQPQTTLFKADPAWPNGIG